MVTVSMVTVSMVRLLRWVALASVVAVVLEFVVFGLFSEHLELWSIRSRFWNDASSSDQSNGANRNSLRWRDGGYYENVSVVANQSDLLMNPRSVWPFSDHLDDRILSQLDALGWFAKTRNTASTMKVILRVGTFNFNHLDWRDGRDHLVKDRCPITNCLFTSNQSLSRSADAVVISELEWKDVKRLTPKAAHQVWVALYLEPPHQRPLNAKALGDLVNWTMSYRPDSTIVTPYGKWIPKFPMSKPNHTRTSKAKNKDHSSPTCLNCFNVNCTLCSPVDCAQCTEVVCTECTNVSCTNCSRAQCTNCLHLNNCSHCSQLNCTGCSNVNCTNCSNMNCRNCSNVNCTGCSNVKCTNCSNVNCTNCSNMNCTNCSNVKCKNCSNMKCTNCSNMNCTGGQSGAQVSARNTLRVNYAKGRTKKVAMFVSNCQDRNGRRQYAWELRKYIDVDIYGTCPQFLSCTKSEKDRCFEMLKRDYKFFLAFENSNCVGYITEKLHRNAFRNDVIPIVMGARPEDYALAAPPGSYIHVDDFRSPRHLAEYLNQLDANDTLYNEYFSYKDNFRYLDILETRYWCRLCGLLHLRDYFNYVTWYKNFDERSRETCSRLQDGRKPWKTWRKGNTETSLTKELVEILLSMTK